MSDPLPLDIPQNVFLDTRQYRIVRQTDTMVVLMDLNKNIFAMKREHLKQMFSDHSMDPGDGVVSHLIGASRIPVVNSGHSTKAQVAYGVNSTSSLPESTAADVGPHTSIPLGSTRHMLPSPSIPESHTLPNATGIEELSMVSIDTSSQLYSMGPHNAHPSETPKSIKPPYTHAHSQHGREKPLENSALMFSHLPFSERDFTSTVRAPVHPTSIPHNTSLRVCSPALPSSAPSFSSASASSLAVASSTPLSSSAYCPATFSSSYQPHHPLYSSRPAHSPPLHTHTYAHPVHTPSLPAPVLIPSHSTQPPSGPVHVATHAAHPPPSATHASVHPIHLASYPAPALSYTHHTPTHRLPAHARPSSTHHTRTPLLPHTHPYARQTPSQGHRYMYTGGAPPAYPTSPAHHVPTHSTHAASHTSPFKLPTHTIQAAHTQHPMYTTHTTRHPHPPHSTHPHASTTMHPPNPVHPSYSSSYSSHPSQSSQTPHPFYPAHSSHASHSSLPHLATHPSHSSQHIHLPPPSRPPHAQAHCSYPPHPPHTPHLPLHDPSQASHASQPRHAPHPTLAPHLSEAAPAAHPSHSLHASQPTYPSRTSHPSPPWRPPASSHPAYTSQVLPVHPSYSPSSPDSTSTHPSTLVQYSYGHGPHNAYSNAIHSNSAAPSSTATEITTTAATPPAISTTPAYISAASSATTEATVAVASTTGPSGHAASISTAMAMPVDSAPDCTSTMALETPTSMRNATAATPDASNATHVDIVAADAVATAAGSAGATPVPALDRDPNVSALPMGPPRSLVALDTTVHLHSDSESHQQQRHEQKYREQHQEDHGSQHLQYHQAQYQQQQQRNHHQEERARYPHQHQYPQHQHEQQYLYPGHQQPQSRDYLPHQYQYTHLSPYQHVQQPHQPYEGEYYRQYHQNEPHHPYPQHQYRQYQPQQPSNVPQPQQHQPQYRHLSNAQQHHDQRHISLFSHDRHSPQPCSPLPAHPSLSEHPSLPNHASLAYEASLPYEALLPSHPCHAAHITPISHAPHPSSTSLQHAHHTQHTSHPPSSASHPRPSSYSSHPPHPLSSPPTHVFRPSQHAHLAHATPVRHATTAHTNAHGSPTLHTTTAHTAASHASTRTSTTPQTTINIDVDAVPTAHTAGTHNHVLTTSHHTHNAPHTHHVGHTDYAHFTPHPAQTGYTDLPGNISYGYRLNDSHAAAAPHSHSAYRTMGYHQASGPHSASAPVLTNGHHHVDKHAEPSYQLTTNHQHASGYRHTGAYIHASDNQHPDASHSTHASHFAGEYGPIHPSRHPDALRLDRAPHDVVSTAYASHVRYTNISDANFHPTPLPNLPHTLPSTGTDHANHSLRDDASLSASDGIHVHNAQPAVYQNVDYSDPAVVPLSGLSDDNTDVSMPVPAPTTTNTTATAMNDAAAIAASTAIDKATTAATSITASIATSSHTPATNAVIGATTDIDPSQNMGSLISITSKNSALMDSNITINAIINTNMSPNTSIGALRATSADAAKGICDNTAVTHILADTIPDNTTAAAPTAITSTGSLTTAPTTSTTVPTDNTTIEAQLPRTQTSAALESAIGTAFATPSSSNAPIASASTTATSAAIATIYPGAVRLAEVNANAMKPCAVDIDSTMVKDTYTNTAAIVGVNDSTSTMNVVASGCSTMNTGADITRPRVDTHTTPAHVSVPVAAMIEAMNDDNIDAAAYDANISTNSLVAESTSTKALAHAATASKIAQVNGPATTIATDAISINVSPAARMDTDTTGAHVDITTVETSQIALDAGLVKVNIDTSMSLATHQDVGASTTKAKADTADIAKLVTDANNNTGSDSTAGGIQKSAKRNDQESGKTIDFDSQGFSEKFYVKPRLMQYASMIEMPLSSSRADVHTRTHNHRYTSTGIGTGANMGLSSGTVTGTYLHAHTNTSSINVDSDANSGAHPHTQSTLDITGKNPPLGRHVRINSYSSQNSGMLTGLAAIPSMSLSVVSGKSAKSGKHVVSRNKTLKYGKSTIGELLSSAALRNNSLYSDLVSSSHTRVSSNNGTGAANTHDGKGNKRSQDIVSKNKDYTRFIMNDVDNMSNISLPTGKPFFLPNLTRTLSNSSRITSLTTNSRLSGLTNVTSLSNLPQKYHAFTAEQSQSKKNGVLEQRAGIALLSSEKPILRLANSGNYFSGGNIANSIERFLLSPPSAVHTRINHLTNTSHIPANTTSGNRGGSSARAHARMDTQVDGVKDFARNMVNMNTNRVSTSTNAKGINTSTTAIDNAAIGSSASSNSSNRTRTSNKSNSNIAKIGKGRGGPRSGSRAPEAEYEEEKSGDSVISTRSSGSRKAIDRDRGGDKGSTGEDGSTARGSGHALRKVTTPSSVSHLPLYSLSSFSSHTPISTLHHDSALTASTTYSTLHAKASLSTPQASHIQYPMLHHTISLAMTQDGGVDGHDTLSMPLPPFSEANEPVFPKDLRGRVSFAQDSPNLREHSHLSSSATSVTTLEEPSLGIYMFSTPEQQVPTNIQSIGTSPNVNTTFTTNTLHTPTLNTNAHVYDSHGTHPGNSGGYAARTDTYNAGSNRYMDAMSVTAYPDTNQGHLTATNTYDGHASGYDAVTNGRSTAAQALSAAMNSDSPDANTLHASTNAYSAGTNGYGVVLNTHGTRLSGYNGTDTGTGPISMNGYDPTSSNGGVKGHMFNNAGYGDYTNTPHIYGTGIYANGDVPIPSIGSARNPGSGSHSGNHHFPDSGNHGFSERDPSGHGGTNNPNNRKKRVNAKISGRSGQGHDDEGKDYANDGSNRRKRNRQPRSHTDLYYGDGELINNAGNGGGVDFIMDTAENDRNNCVKRQRRNDYDNAEHMDIIEAIVDNDVNVQVMAHNFPENGTNLRNNANSTSRKKLNNSRNASKTKKSGPVPPVKISTYEAAQNTRILLDTKWTSFLQQSICNHPHLASMVKNIGYPLSTEIFFVRIAAIHEYGGDGIAEYITLTDQQRFMMAYVKATYPLSPSLSSQSPSMESSALSSTHVGSSSSSSSSASTSAATINQNGKNEQNTDDSDKTSASTPQTPFLCGVNITIDGGMVGVFGKEPEPVQSSGNTKKKPAGPGKRVLPTNARLSKEAIKKNVSPKTNPQLSKRHDEGVDLDVTATDSGNGNCGVDGKNHCGGNGHGMNTGTVIGTPICPASAGGSCSTPSDDVNGGICGSDDAEACNSTTCGHINIGSAGSSRGAGNAVTHTNDKNINMTLNASYVDKMNYTTAGDYTMSGLDTHTDNATKSGTVPVEVDGGVDVDVNVGQRMAQSVGMGGDKSSDLGIGADRDVNNVIDGSVCDMSHPLLLHNMRDEHAHRGTSHDIGNGAPNAKMSDTNLNIPSSLLFLWNFSQLTSIPFSQCLKLRQLLYNDSNIEPNANLVQEWRIYIEKQGIVGYNADVTLRDVYVDFKEKRIVNVLVQRYTEEEQWLEQQKLQPQQQRSEAHEHQHRYSHLSSHAIPTVATHATASACHHAASANTTSTNLISATNTHSAANMTTPALSALTVTTTAASTSAIAGAAPVAPVGGASGCNGASIAITSSGISTMPPSTSMPTSRSSMLTTSTSTLPNAAAIGTTHAQQTSQVSTTHTSSSSSSSLALPLPLPQPFLSAYASGVHIGASSMKLPQFSFSTSDFGYNLQNLNRSTSGNSGESNVPVGAALFSEKHPSGRSDLPERGISLSISMDSDTHSRVHTKINTCTGSNTATDTDTTAPAHTTDISAHYASAHAKSAHSHIETATALMSTSSMDTTHTNTNTGIGADAISANANPNTHDHGHTRAPAIVQTSTRAPSHSCAASGENEEEETNCMREDKEHESKDCDHDGTGNGCEEKNKALHARRSVNTQASLSTSSSCFLPSFSSLPPVLPSESQAAFSRLPIMRPFSAKSASPASYFSFTSSASSSSTSSSTSSSPSISLSTHLHHPSFTSSSSMNPQAQLRPAIRVNNANVSSISELFREVGKFLKKNPKNANLSPEAIFAALRKRQKVGNNGSSGPFDDYMVKLGEYGSNISVSDGAVVVVVGSSSDSGSGGVEYVNDGNKDDDHDMDNISHVVTAITNNTSRNTTPANTSTIATSISLHKPLRHPARSPACKPHLLHPSHHMHHSFAASRPTSRSSCPSSCPPHHYQHPARSLDLHHSTPPWHPPSRPSSRASRSHHNQRNISNTMLSSALMPSRLSRPTQVPLPSSSRLPPLHIQHAENTDSPIALPSLSAVWSNISNNSLRNGLLPHTSPIFDASPRAFTYNTGTGVGVSVNVSTGVNVDVKMSNGSGSHGGIAIGDSAICDVDNGNSATNASNGASEDGEGVGNAHGVNGGVDYNDTRRDGNHLPTLNADIVSPIIPTPLSPSLSSLTHATATRHIVDDNDVNTTTITSTSMSTSANTGMNVPAYSNTTLPRKRKSEGTAGKGISTDGVRGHYCGGSHVGSEAVEDVSKFGMYVPVHVAQVWQRVRALTATAVSVLDVYKNTPADSEAYAGVEPKARMIDENDSHVGAAEHGASDHVDGLRANTQKEGSMSMSSSGLPRESREILQEAIRNIFPNASFTPHDMDTHDPVYVTRKLLDLVTDISEVYFNYYSHDTKNTLLTDDP